MTHITVLGAGSWGLTLAWLYAGAGHYVTLWDRKPEKLEQLSAQPALTYPVRITMPSAVHYQPNLAMAVAQAHVILLAVTTMGTRPVAQQLAECLTHNPHALIINVSKGIEQPSLQRLYDVLTALLPKNPVAVLSGPTLAQEIINGLPTACVLSSRDVSACQQWQTVLTVSNQFRIYSNTDVIGVELGGALKNIFAIASGYMATKGLGDNARAALITRGLHEMTQFAAHHGAEDATLYGLSGLGDLLATCNSPLSRNYQVGVGLAEGLSLPQIQARIGTVAEGIGTTFAVQNISQQQNIDMPVTHLIAQALKGQVGHDDFISQLMSRRLRSEAN
jgi:glycerol-3-phosphate dehydrogenase (NAD(P)+)